jgi:hypothetical protein
MPGLWKYNKDTPEGKYLVKRRDGTVPDWPHFVLGGADPAAPWALRAYAVAAFLLGFDRAYACDVWRRARDFVAYRCDPAHRKGDPDAPRHRIDDPATVAEMRRGEGS